MVCLNIYGLPGVFATFRYFNQGYKGLFGQASLGTCSFRVDPEKENCHYLLPQAPSPSSHRTSDQERAVSRHPVLPSTLADY